ncbi:spore coat protein YsxE [Peribacillus glennii]|uniref:Spore coat protein YsxE n=1 Tax=Peribacillus glennii TaxID=2303991 RepID=A0A372LHX4_9BACI|nr:spore coat protein YsxE [Peribacillus glennii]RFU65893.1 spore coat protein YsxE [Peribacillus glennii]
MEDKQEFNDTEVILHQYSLHARYVENFGKVKKVYSDKGIFALKVISPQKGMDFFRNIQFLYQRGYNRIVPIYPATDGRYAVLHGGHLYYLMPWLLNEDTGERDERHMQLFRELARMHTLSMKERPVKKEEREEHYEETIKQWKEQREFIEEFAGESEKKWYMSPFQLLLCMYYTDITQALNYAEKKLEEWFKKTKEDEKVRTVITHGKLSMQHFIYDDRGYGHFINFEDSKTVPPHFDLLPFLVRSARTYPTRCDDCVSWLYNYLKYFPLKDEEMLLFQSYLAYPGSSIQTVRNYFEKKGGKSELYYVSQLQRQYWLLKNTEYMVMKIEEIEQQKKAAAGQEQSQS